MRKSRFRGILTVAVMLIALCQALIMPASAAETIPVVKVGYFQMEGFNEIDDDGLYSGYNYDFFQLLGRYTNLNFEFVGYDKSWQEMQEMLQNGEIDILTSMHSTEDRQEKYDFSYDIGSSYTMLTIKLGNNSIQGGDYQTYEGMKVGMLKESSQNDVFDEFAQENGFSYEPVYFDSVSELSDAVHSGEVDSAVTSSLRQLNGERVIEEIGTAPFYAAVKKGNTSLLDEINQGITQMDIYDGDWRNTLYYRYYGYQSNTDSELSAVYSEREQTVIDEYSKNGKTLLVCFDPTLAPYSFVKDGEMVGILPDAVAEVLNSIGVNYEFAVLNSHDEYLKMCESGGADIFPELIADSSVTAQENYLFTDSYFTMRVGMITNKSWHKDKDVVALVNNCNFYNDLNLSGQKVRLYDSSEDVVNAVVNGEADAGYLMNYTAQMYINSQKLTELAYVSQPDIQYSVSFGVNKNIPHEFCSILNKNIGTLTAVDFYSLSLEYIGTDLTDLTFVEYLQLHPRTAAALFILVIVLVVVILVMAFVSRHKAEREKQQRDLREAYRKTEAALAEAQQYRHAVLSDAFVVYDANITKNIIDEEICEEYGNVRHSLFEPLGLSAPCCYETYIDKVCERMTQLDDREVFREKLSREYLLSLFEQGRTEDVFEYRTKLIDGQTADVRHTTYLTADSAGNVIAHINDKNITAQKKNEQQIRKYEQILITTATDTYKGVRRVDLDTGQAEYIRFNDGQITQSDMGDWTEWMSRQNVNIHPDDFERMKKFLSIENFNKMKVGVTLRQDYRSLATNHKNFHRVYTTTASVSYLGDKKVAVMTTMDNTSAVENEMEQKKLVEDALRSAEEANSAKTVFLSNMSHDIRTPMNAIIGFTNLAQTHMNDKEQVKNYLEKISSSSMHLLSLINDVLDMSRIESGRLQLEESECSLKELAEEVSEIVQSDIESKGLSFTVDTSDIRDDRVICDKVRLKRVLLNLLSNAVKFTDTGGITVTLREVNSDGKETAVYEFHVQDTGIGISEEFIRHVFEPFERERNTTVSGVQGTGLGMSISKNIVDMMGGNISVNSVQGKGSEFTAIIPMKKTGTITDITHEAQKDFSRENIKGKKVLLVEDNELNREIAAEILRDAGVITEEADDGSVAVEMLNQMGGDYYDLVLMDIQMPKMDGYTATRIIRKSKDKAIAKIPIIAMTANAFEEDRQKAIAAGMNAHLPKPISVDLLLDTLEQLIG